MYRIDFKEIWKTLEFIFEEKYQKEIDSDIETESFNYYFSKIMKKYSHGL